LKDQNPNLNLAELAPVGIYIVQQGKFRYVNSQFQSDTGYGGDELLGSDPMRIVTPEDRDVARANTIAMARGRRPYPSGFRIITKTGQTKWVMETVTPITYQGKPAVLGIYLDITERKQIEAEMQEIVELNRLKSNLLSTISHELRTPLATIKGYASMLITYDRRLERDEKLDGMAAIDRATDRLAGLVDDLLDLSRLETGMMKLERTITDVAALLKSAAAECQMRQPEHRISFGRGRKLPEAVIDARRVRQIVDNLLDNAAKYSPKGGSIIIRAAHRDDELLISVRDHGLGIPESELERIFDRMYRLNDKAHRRAGGIGLGLAICKGLVEGHGGRIWAESKEGSGSTFFFTLPLGVTEGAGDAPVN